MRPGIRPDQVAVWAPHATVVELLIGDASQKLEREAGGWFVSEPLPFGTDYLVRLDGGEGRPDPRSRSQPKGVHGPSRLWDPGAFEWHDAQWHGVDLAGSVIYELHVGTFAEEGTFDGVLAHFDHLAALGVSIVELMPVAEFAGRRGWGYDGVGLFAPHHAYGGPDGLDRLVDAAHARGLAVMLDVVYNHLGPEGNYLAEFGPYFSEVHRTPWGAAVNLDGPGSFEVRRFFIDNACYWLADHHLDGLRLDAVHALVDDSAQHLLAELSGEIDALAAHFGRRLLLVAESETNDPMLTMSRDANGTGLTGQWSDDVHHAIHTALTGEHTGYYEPFHGLPDVADAMRHAFVARGQVDPSGRRRGAPVPHDDGNRFVAFAQNHDHVGNRAAGDRLVHQAGAEKAMVAAALIAFSPFTPLLFQGEEWGASSPFCFFAEFDDPVLAEAVRRGRREEFAGFEWADDVPDPLALETFERSRLDWSEIDREPHRRLVEWHRDLLALRRVWPELTDGRRDLVEIEEASGDVLLARRGRLLLLAVTSDRQVPMPPGTVLLASPAPFDPSGVELQGPAAVIVRTA
jgi:maltooligosyltrehalose trehalohydrolase